MSNKLKVGDYVRVKDGLKEPDYNSIFMDNWQGEIIHIENNLVEISLDSKTISNLPVEYLIRLENDGLSIEQIQLYASDVRIVPKRSSTVRDEKMAESKLYWIMLYEDEALKYLVYFQDVDVNDYSDMYSKWIDYLTENLKFPLDVEVVETMRGGLKIGEKIKLLDLEDYDDKYGILGIGKSKRGAVTWPICDLEVIDKNSSNYQPLKDYCIWFANM